VISTSKFRWIGGMVNLRGTTFLKTKSEETNPPPACKFDPASRARFIANTSQPGTLCSPPRPESYQPFAFLEPPTELPTTPALRCLR
jgi:hypothetical protein